MWRSWLRHKIAEKKVHVGVVYGIGVIDYTDDAAQKVSSHRVKFENYNVDELSKLFLHFLKQEHKLDVTDEAMKKLSSQVSSLCSHRSIASPVNARTMKMLANEVASRCLLRLSEDFKTTEISVPQAPVSTISAAVTAADLEGVDFTLGTEMPRTIGFK